MTEKEAIKWFDEHCLEKVDKGGLEAKIEACRALHKLDYLSRFIPELTEEHNKCFELMDEFTLKGATPFECKAFTLCGAVMQSLGAILNVLESTKGGENEL